MRDIFGKYGAFPFAVFRLFHVNDQRSRGSPFTASSQLLKYGRYFSMLASLSSSLFTRSGFLCGSLSGLCQTIVVPSFTTLTVFGVIWPSFPMWNLISKLLLFCDLKLTFNSGPGFLPSLSGGLPKSFLLPWKSPVIVKYYIKIAWI